MNSEVTWFRAKSPTILPASVIVSSIDYFLVCYCSVLVHGKVESLPERQRSCHSVSEEGADNESVRTISFLSSTYVIVLHSPLHTFSAKPFFKRVQVGTLAVLVLWVRAVPVRLWTPKPWVRTAREKPRIPKLPLVSWVRAV